MKRVLLLVLLPLLLAACMTTATKPSTLPVAITHDGGTGSRQPLHSPNALTPVTTVAKAIVEPRIRVGMLTDQSSVDFPRIEGGYLLITGEGTSTLRRGFTAAAPLANAPVRYAVQVAAISDKGSVDNLMARLRTATTQRVDAIFDPSASNGGIYRILAGEFSDAVAANPLRDELTRGGFGRDMTVTRRPADATFDSRLSLTDDEGDRATLTGQSVLVMPATAETIAIAQKPYRTAVRLFINQRGLINVINELNLEDYLRGVVPAEMGSKIYDELEALKAQAIAARTYAVRNMGGFSREGFDICPGPACQAYLGFAGEETLSSRAVTETAGLVMTSGGRPIDALYTATCGGETSDVGTMFPGRDEPYLRGVRCVELDMLTIEGRSDSGLLTEMQMSARQFAALAGIPEGGPSWSGAEVRAAVGAAARLIGWQEPALTSPTSSRRRDVLRYLAAFFRLDANARVLTLPEDRAYFFPQSSGTDSPEYLAAAFLVKYGVWPAQEIDRINLDAAMPREELYALLGGWLKEHERLAEATGKIAGLDGRKLILKADGKLTSYQLPMGIPVYRRLGDRFEEYAKAPVMIGDRAVVQLDTRKKPVALIVVANYDGASFDRTSSFANWTRSYRADELVKSINNRNPIQQLIDLRPVTIDASHRIAELEVTAEGGRKFMLRGLPVRWSLGVPDNLFVFEKTKDDDGADRYTFFGKGWGHGVGMCQVGAYGMAFRGSKAEEILRHYYTGIEIEPMAVNRQK